MLVNNCSRHDREPNESSLATTPPGLFRASPRVCWFEVCSYISGKARIRSGAFVDWGSCDCESGARLRLDRYRTDKVFAAARCGVAGREFERAGKRATASHAGTQAPVYHGGYRERIAGAWRPSLPMITPEEALARILAAVRSKPSREVPLLEAVDRFAAEDLFARLSLPVFDNSAMDGYAVIASSCAAGRLRVVGEQPAGMDRQLSIKPGEAIRIFTGAPLPSGADAVVMQEDVRVEDGEIVLETSVAPGEFVRRRGTDVAEGQKLLTVGERVSVQMTALLAAQGLSSVRVGAEVRASLISTGDELAFPGAELQRGQIYESNSVFLEALLRKYGVDVVSVQRCADRPDQIEAAVNAGVSCDVMIVTGGVSVGAHDLVKAALSQVGATLDLWRVAVKPGKPFLFGRAEDCAIFGLPGNPVSAFVTFLLFVRPALLKMMGAGTPALPLPQTAARLSEKIHNDGPRPHYVRGMLRDGTFTPIGLQESHALLGLSRSNALLLAPPGETIAAGSTVTALCFD